MYGRGIDLKILLVNSDQDFIDNFKYSFKTEDYTITSTKTIKEAIDAFSKYHYDSISHSQHDRDHNSIFDDANYDEKLSNVNLEVYNYD